MHVLMVGTREGLPAQVGTSPDGSEWTVDYASDIESAQSLVQAAEFDALVVENQSSDTPAFRKFIRYADSNRIATLVLGEMVDDRATGTCPLIGSFSADITPGEITRQLALLTRFRSHIKLVEHELAHMQKLGDRLTNHFREVDDEMRLASRLQKDFLPRDIERMGPLKFSHVYRPATWVSGDVFDIQRVDEDHIGFYIADAVGHGMAAGLLTMFIRRALNTKLIEGDDFTLLEPHEALQHLNNALAEHCLPNCQFVTAAYCLVNTKTLEMRYARGGHPYPLHYTNGRTVELESGGGLLGLFEGVEIDTATVQLHPGDKIILYTDGMEAAFESLNTDHNKPLTGHIDVLAAAADRPVSDLTASVVDKLENEHGSLTPEDDITILAVEVAADGDA